LSTTEAIEVEECPLAERIRGGDVGAEETLVDKYQRPVYAIAVARIRDRETARDLAQEILLMVLEALRAGKLRDVDRLSAFVHATARNRINTHITNLHREQNRSPILDAPPVVTPEERFEQSQRGALVRRAIARLNPADQKILLLTLVDGLKPREIAARLDISQERLRKRKSRALERVKQAVCQMSRTSGGGY
jgi:RNA polymerase sigma-70 factor (ECF subfamily)